MNWALTARVVVLLVVIAAFCGLIVWVRSGAGDDK